MIKKVIIGESDTVTKDEVIRMIRNNEIMSVFGFKNFDCLSDEECVYVLVKPPSQGKYIWMTLAYKSSNHCGEYQDLNAALDEMNDIYITNTVDDVIEVIKKIKNDHLIGRRRY